MAELSRTQALKLLKEAAALNPGPWEKHSLMWRFVRKI